MDDVDSAMELSASANWNQTPEDWRRVIHLAPGSCSCVEDGEKIVATTTLLSYGQQLAWIGMVLTRPEYRRQGLAKRLVQDALVAAKRMGIHTVKLDATDEGRPLYESLGFIVEQVIERWGTNPGSVVIENNARIYTEAGRERPWQAGLPEDLVAMDARAFGASRGHLLELLMKSGECDVTANGYVLSRPGKFAWYLGPCVANSEPEASELVSQHLKAKMDESRGWYWDLLSNNKSSIRCAERFGFTRRRTLWRMRLGQAVENNDAMMYAIAGFELG